MPSRVLWVHGHSGQLQTTYSGLHVERLGYYLRIKADRATEGWLHYSPTTILTDQPARPTKVFVRFQTFGDAYLGRVHVWDAAEQIAAHDYLKARSPDGGASRIGILNKDEGPFGELRIDLAEGCSPATGGIGVSLLIVARKDLDAVAVVGIGVELTDIRSK